VRVWQTGWALWKVQADVNALVLGIRRQGKSTLSLRLAQARASTTVIFDPNEQFRNFPAVDVNDVEEALQATVPEKGHRDRPAVVRVVPELEPESCFDTLSETLWTGRWDDMTLIVDEANTVQTANQINGNLERILRRAPAAFHTIQTSHRIVDFHRISRSVSITDVFAFRSVQVGDIKRMGEEIDDRMVGVLPTLGKYEVAHWWIDQGGYRALSVWRRPEEWYVDIGRPDGVVEEPKLDEKGQALLYRPEGDTKSEDDPVLRGLKRGK